MWDDKRPSRGARIAALLLTLCGIATVQAQTATTEAGPAKATCLVKPAELLQYPDRDSQLRSDGYLQARLTFSGPDRAPEVELLAYGGSSEMSEAAQRYLYRYRLPCLAPGERLVLDQEVLFTAIAREDEKHPPGKEKTACLRTPGPFEIREEIQTGRLIPQKTRGNLLLDLTFTSPDAPPAVTERYNSAPGNFVSAVLAHVRDYRLPCFKPGEPVVVRQLFHYAGSARAADLALKDLGLVSFLRSVKDVDKVPVKFDLDSMSCPFQVKWHMYQPADDNVVEELGRRVAARRDFLRWLASLSLNIKKDHFEALLGAQMVITVPCGKVEL